ncbi:TetR/AcrR family transcriptional regulator [Mycobacterium sp. IDR2000157661]|uniref:TetR/AcrR family transcriptional regulator n=1 Tax=Mycobacterium sp. IDR2000157661 TaxID=2867005 RepID=UPI001EEA15CB|nr:TetR/AcrR family transcriptional regulator [Mycobacterium sp. IDR2000157661]ULE32367.1 TetR/AcrR family transcriptional regulator [Mycobacterium sp. IDR2000157661]
MSGVVKRGYRSDLRAQQARQTQRRVIAAAARLFVERGFAATTVDAVADAAGVSRKTVFTAAGGKPELLKTALDWAVAGDDEPRALIEREAVRQLLEHTEPEALLAGWVRLVVDIDVRVGPLVRVLEVAADTDAQAAELVEQMCGQRLAGARTVVRRLAELDALRPGLNRREAVDITWLATDAVLYDRLVGARGWSRSRFENWLAAALRIQLLGP